jgi:peroxiredoxin
MHLRIFYILFSFISFCPSLAIAQPYEKLKLSSDKPEAGKEIQFTYSGVFSKKIDSRITMYYRTSRGLEWQSLNLTHNDGLVQGTFTVPDSALAFCLKPRNNRDTVEAFIFNVFKGGKLLKGSLAAGATFYANSITHNGIRDNRAKALYLQEFSINPEIKPKRLLDYLEAGCLVPDPAMITLFRNTWRDSLSKGKSESFFVRLYQIGLRYKDLQNKELLKGDMLAKYPFGEVALADDLKDYRLMIRTNTFRSKIIELEQKYAGFAAIGQLDNVYKDLAESYFNKLQVDSAMHYLEKVKRQTTKRDLYLYGCKKLLKEKVQLQKALIYAQEAIKIQEQIKIPSYSLTSESDQSYQESLKGFYLSLLAKVKYELGDIRGALRDLAAADKINTWDSELRENYVQYLLNNNNASKAVELASKYVIEDRATDGILANLKAAYLKNTANGDFEKYYQELLRTSENHFQLPEYSKLNVAAPSFTLADLKGEEVSSENLQGKGIVLYFFSPNYSNSFGNSRDSIFNVMATKFSDNKDLIFLGIDKTQIFEQDEVKREHIRTYKLKEFMALKDYTFNILLDRLNYNPKNTGLTYFSVADDYSSGDMGQFYIINKAGIVKYKSYSGTNFQRELKAALALAQ